jgi:hypothetical protein
MFGELKKLSPVRFSPGYYGMIINVVNEKLMCPEYDIFYNDGKKWNIVRIDSTKIGIKYNPGFIYTQCKAKIKDYKKSGFEFGFPTKKMNLVGQTLRITEIEGNYETRRGNIVDVISLDVNGSSLKFCMDDIEIIYPPYKGFNPKKDRTIKIGLTLIPKKSRDILDKNKEYILNKILRKD